MSETRPVYAAEPTRLDDMQFVGKVDTSGEIEVNDETRDFLAATLDI